MGCLAKRLERSNVCGRPTDFPPDHVAHHRCQRVVCVLENVGQPRLQLGRLLREDDAALQKKRAYLVDYRSAPRDEPVTNTVHRLKVELIVSLDRDEAHVLALDGFGDGFRVDEVVLVGLHKRLHELRCDLRDIVALLLQRSRKEMRSRACFETDQRGLHVRSERQQLLLRELFLHEHSPDAPSATR
jgi:hypothetical protein